MAFPEALGTPRMHKNSTFTIVIQIMLYTIQFMVCLLGSLVYSPFVHLALDELNHPIHSKILQLESN